MTISQSLLAHLRDSRLAPYATSPVPAWLWAADASRILWTNAAGAAAFGESSAKALGDRRFEHNDAAAREISALTNALPAAGTAQLARLRGFGGGVGRAILCACSRVQAPDGSAAILVAATEPVGPALSFAERVRRLFAGSDEILAAFAGDGALLHAGPEATDWLAGYTTLASLEAGDLAAEALRQGRAAGDSLRGPLTLEKIGSGGTFLLATFAGLAAPRHHFAPATAPAEETPAPASAAEQSVMTRAADPAVERLHSADAPQGIPDTEENTAADGKPAAAAEPAASPQDITRTGMVTAVDIASEAPPQSEECSPQPADQLQQSADPIDEQALLAELQSRLVERRHPLRFVWQTDAEGRFTIASDDFVELVGRRTASLLGRPWVDIAAKLGLDPERRLELAFASHDTWSSVMLDWPAGATAEPLPVALSGLPLFGRDRAFAGYRGFGVCRNVDRIAAVIAARRAAIPAAAVPQSDGPAAPSTEPASVNSADADAIDAGSQPAAPAGSMEGRVADSAVVPPASAEGRPQLTVVPPAKNVVPFRGGPTIPPEKRAVLTPVERNAFQEIAKALGARVEGDPSDPAEMTVDAADPSSASEAHGAADQAGALPGSQAAAVPAERLVLDRMPVAVLAYRVDKLIYANRAFLDWTGFGDLEDLAAAGGLNRLFSGPGSEGPGEPDGPGRAVAIATRGGGSLQVEGRLFTVPWNGETALLLLLTRGGGPDDRYKSLGLALRAAQAEARELGSILDTATDGVIVTDAEGRVLAGNRSAEALFGYDGRELVGRSFSDLFAPESHREALDYLDGLVRSGVASILNDGREVIGRERQGGLIPLFMTMGRIADQPAKFCAVFRDITQWKRAEEELVNAKRQAEKASSAKSDFLAKISHEIRTPLNAIIGFSEVMMEQRFGPIGNERYRGYLNDIHTSGQHLIALLTDLLDLSKIEAGKIELSFGRVDLNAVTQEAVAIMQPQANRERIIIRTSLSVSLPPVVADTRSIRQIVLNLLSNSIKFTGAGGQVIVSTALTETGEAVLRVRDTGVGMSDNDIATALEPFRQLATSSRWGSAVGSGLGLPLTKALAEANRASFHIKSAVNSGTLVEIVFPGTRVLAE